MVGNVYEWVEDWVPESTECVDEFFSGTDDADCLAGASTSLGPGALLRGGDFGLGTGAGVFAVDGFSPPSDASSHFGFRCGR